MIKISSTDADADGDGDADVAEEGLRKSNIIDLCICMQCTIRRLSTVDTEIFST